MIGLIGKPSLAQQYLWTQILLEFNLDAKRLKLKLLRILGRCHCRNADAKEITHSSIDPIRGIGPKTAINDLIGA